MEQKLNPRDYLERNRRELWNSLSGALEELMEDCEL